MYVLCAQEPKPISLSVGEEFMRIVTILPKNSVDGYHIEPIISEFQRSDCRFLLSDFKNIRLHVLLRDLVKLKTGAFVDGPSQGIQVCRELKNKSTCTCVLIFIFSSVFI